MVIAGYVLPSLVGFEYSQSDAHREQTEIVKEAEHKIYRHLKALIVPEVDLLQPLGDPG